LLNTRYPFLTAYFKGEEARLVTSDHINRMSNVSSIQDIFGIIKETDMGSYFDGVLVETFDDLDEHLWLYFGKCLERIEWFKPVPADILKILKAYVVKYDVLNIKAAVQAISTGKQASKIPIGVIHNHGLLDELSSAETVDSIIELLTKCKLGNYAAVLKECNIDEEMEPKLMAEAKLDGEYHKNLMDITKNIKDGSILFKTFGIIVDMKNLQVILRAIITGAGPRVAEYTISSGYMVSSDAIKELLSLKLSDVPSRLVNTQYSNVVEEVAASYDETKNIAVVDQIIEKHKFRLIKEMLSPRVLSPLMAAWYLILKEVEIRNLRLILKAMFDNISVEEVKDYLVLI